MSVGGISGFVLLQCRFGSDYTSWTRLIVNPCRSELSKKNHLEQFLVPQVPVLVAAGSHFDSRPSSSHGDVKGTDILPVKWRRSSFRPLHTAEFKWISSSKDILEILEVMFDSVPAVFSAALRVLPAAGAQRLHAVPAPQQRALGPLQQTAKVLRERQWSDLRRGRETSTLSCGDDEREWTQLYELSLPERHRRVPGAARPGWSFPEESSWCFQTWESVAWRGMEVHPWLIY